MKTLALEQVIIKRLLEQEQEEPVSIQPNSTIYVDMDPFVLKGEVRSEFREELREKRPRI